jgi:FeS assembly SUF system protein
MFSFLKSLTEKSPETAADHGQQPDPAPAEAPPADTAPAEAPAADNPLAAMVWDAPDVPRADDGPDVSSPHGLDIGALLEPPAATSARPASFGEKDQARTDALKPLVVEAISTIFDPEIPVNIYELGLIYDIVADADGNVLVTMTLTSPACPSAQQLPAEAKFKTKSIPGVADAHVEVVWEPSWTKDMMSETAKMALGMF